MINPRLPEAFFCNLSTEGGGYHPSLDFRYKASDCYDLGTRGYESSLSIGTKSTSGPSFDVTMAI